MIRPLLALGVLMLLYCASGRAETDNLEFLGHNENNPFHLMHAEVVGKMAYISEGLGIDGVETYDISDPHQPIRVDEDGPLTWRTRAIPERGWLLGFSHAEGVQIYDITTTTELLREFDPPDMIHYEGGALSGDLLYVAAHQQGIDVLDASDPGPIGLIETIDLGENAAWDVEVVGQIALVANGRFGMSVVDLNAVPPSVVRTIALPGLANDLVIDGSVAYLSLGPEGLASFDLSNPSDPVLLSHNTEATGNVTGISILGDLLVAGAWKRLETYDISDPQDIRLVGWDDTKTWAMGAAFNQDSLDPIIAVADWRGVSTYRPNADTGPDIEIVPDRLDFGRVTADRDTTSRIYNRGSSNLEIVGAIIPEGIDVFPSTFIVPPGGFIDVTVTASGPEALISVIRFTTNDPDETTARLFTFKNNTVFPQMGDPVPDFELLGTDGQWHTLAQEKGKVVFLEAGANW